MAPIYFIKTLFIFFTTLIGTYLILPKLIQIASTWVLTTRDSSNKHYSLLDFPDNYRRVHDIPKPIVGGLGMLIIVTFSSLIFVPPTDLNLRGYYSAVILLGIIGFLDDFGNLHYLWKFIGQIVASAIMIQYSETVLSSFGNIPFFGSVDLGIFAIPVTIFCTLGVINALNMIDGLDGLAGGVSLIAFVSFVILTYMNGQMEMMLLSIALSGAVIGFLKYNWYPAKLFMGDAGSYFLGFSLTFLSISLTQSKGSLGLVSPIVPLLILTIPIVDTVTVMIKRIIKGKSPFFADKSHFHHILLRLGLDAKRTVMVILSLSLAFSLLGVVGVILQIREYYLFWIFFIFFIIYFIAHFASEILLAKKEDRVNREEGRWG